MTKIYLLLALVLFIGANSINAQSYRVGNLADQLSRQADELADRAYNDYTRSRNNSRSDLDALMLAQQLVGTSNVFRRLVQDRRNDSKLRDAVNFLVDLTRRFPSYGGNSVAWRDANRTIGDLSRELSGGYSGGGGTENPSRDVIGRVRWRGTVDDEVQLVIKNNSLETRTISGQTYSNATYNFTSALPNRRVNVEVTRRKGRGRVTVLQQPARENDFTTVIQILDKDGGARDYDVEIYWTR